MATGSPAPQPRRGFTYLGLLLLIAVSGAALAALGTQWQAVAAREREQELQFRGEQLRQAIARFRNAREPKAWPVSLDDLLQDERGERVRHHLRQRWADPFTGRADWELLPAPGARTGTAERGFAGVRSRSSATRRQLVGPVPVQVTVQVTAGSTGPPPTPRVSDWIFMHTETAATGTGPRRETQ